MELKEALEVSMHREADSYREALEFLLSGAPELTRRVHFVVPDGAGEEWRTLWEGSEQVCSAGDHRCIVPGKQRQELVAQESRVALKQGDMMYVKPVGAADEILVAAVSVFMHNGTSALQLQIAGLPRPLAFFLDSVQGYLATAASVPWHMPTADPTIKIPLFEVVAVDAENCTATIAVDQDMEVIVVPPQAASDEGQVADEDVTDQQ